MITLHLSIHDDIPHLWIEQGRRTSFNQKGVEVQLQEHTFSPPLKLLEQTLDQVVAGMETPRRLCAKLEAWVPTVKGRAIPSSPLMGELPENESRNELQAVNIVARRLNREELLQFCTIAGNENLRPPGILYGGSVLWAIRIVRFALALVREHCMLPGLYRENTGWVAQWRPLLDAEDQQRRSQLEESMPAAIRCLAGLGEGRPAILPATITDTLLATLVDALPRDPLEMYDPPHESRRRKKQLLHDLWLTALRAPDPILQWQDEDEISAFAAQLEQWRRPVEMSVASPFVLCLRLKDPAEDEEEVIGAWYLEYLVRPRSDPSLLLPLADVWRARSKAARNLLAFGPQLTEYLLTALARIAMLYPPLKTGLRGTHPMGMRLDNAEALDFLRSYALLLQESGVEILYPSWWTRHGAKRRVSLNAKIQAQNSDGLGSFSMDTLLDFSIAASIGGEEVSLDELRALAELKTPLVRLRGQWTYVDPDEIQSVLARFEKQGSQTISARDALRLALGAEGTVNGMRFEQAELDGWLSEIASTLIGGDRLEPLDAPAHFHGLLRPYQQRGYSWLAFLRRWGLGACLADDMGLGKTVQALAMMQRDREAGERRPVLLICPTTVVNNWVREAARFTPSMSVLVHHGPDRHRAKVFLREAKKVHLVVSSYGLLHRDENLLGQVSWAGVVLDEAQNIKNHVTKQARAARALPAEYRLALTGTPVENSVADLWSLMEFLNPGLLGGRTAFRERFQDPIQRWGDQDAAALLRRITGPFILRREKTDRSIISDLPDKIVQKEYCPLTPEQATLYEAVIINLSESLGEKEGMDRRGLMLATLLRLKQICNHPAQFLGDGSEWRHRSGKLRRLMEITEEVRSRGEHLLIFTQFMEMGLLLQQALQEHFTEEVFFLHGGVPRKKRDSMVERFQKDDTAPSVFILSLKAGGTGLTLTRANHVVHFDRWWNPAVENQATDRAFRIGQKKNVQVHTFIVAGTLEERIDEMLERKKDIADSVVGSGEQWLTEMSNENFMKLIRLDDHAAEEDEE